MSAAKRPGFPARLDTGGPVVAAKVASKKIAANPAPTLTVAPFGIKTAVSAALSGSGMGLDSGAARARMVTRIVQEGVRDPLVLAAMGLIERHRFVDTALANQAYEDTSLPIGLGQTISKPSVVARMLELLRLPLQNDGKLLGRVLEIGTGCAYQAALLSRISTEVYSIERLRGLHDKARENLRPLRIPNIHLLLGDGMLGFAKGAPYAAIVSAAGGEAVPQAWIDQLAVGGRIVAPVAGGAGPQRLLVLDKTPRGLVSSTLEAVHFVPLKSGLA